MFWLPAGVVVDEVSALSPVHAGIAQTLVHILLAESSSVPRPAATLEPVDLVHALGLVQTWVGLTLISVDLTPLPIGTQQTMTLK